MEPFLFVGLFFRSHVLLYVSIWPLFMTAYCIFLLILLEVFTSYCFESFLNSEYNAVVVVSGVWWRVL